MFEYDEEEVAVFAPVGLDARHYLRPNLMARELRCFDTYKLKRCGIIPPSGPSSRQAKEAFV